MGGQIGVLEQQVLCIPDEPSMIRLGGYLARSAKSKAIIGLSGDLGSGKTTLCRGVLRALGYRGAVKSPTYTLVEPYALKAQRVYHFDFYRLSDPEELEFLGVRDYFESDAMCLLEWPECGEGFLPTCDLELKLETMPVAQGEAGRRIVIFAHTIRGAKILQRLQDVMAADSSYDATVWKA
jgi:tRNA threonylcarbamoyladenosine biosynthesis protein TsaE